MKNWILSPLLSMLILPALAQATTFEQGSPPPTLAIKYVGISANEADGLYLTRAPDQPQHEAGDSIACGDSFFFGKPHFKFAHGTDKAIFTYTHYELANFDEAGDCLKIAHLVNAATPSCPVQVTFDLSRGTIVDVRDCSAKDAAN